MVQLDRSAAPLVPGGLLLGFEESKDFSWLFAPNYEWIASSFGYPLGGSMICDTLETRQLITLGADGILGYL